MLKGFQQKGMDVGGQSAGGELGEGALEGGFSRHLVGALPAAQAPQLRIAVQALQQMPGGGEIEYRFGQERCRQTETIARAAALMNAPRTDPARELGSQMSEHFLLFMF